MARYCSTGQSPERAVVLMEQENIVTVNADRAVLRIKNFRVILWFVFAISVTISFYKTAVNDPPHSNQLKHFSVVSVILLRLSVFKFGS
jgi:hypothetical protein